MRSQHIDVSIALERIQAAAHAIRAKTGVPLIAVIKSDAYGLGAARVAGALDGLADEFAYFAIQEAQQVQRPGLVLGPPLGEPAEHRALGVRPSISNSEEAARFAGMEVAINVDTGMQRFGCDPNDLDDLLAHCAAREIWTHARDETAAGILRQLGGARALRRHAAATALLDCPDAWLDGVRPGLGLYQGAVRVTSRLITVRPTRGPVGYSGLECSRIGVFVGGYSNHVQPAPVLINGRKQRILEVGMNTSIVSVDTDDRVGDEVVLLGDGLSEEQLARHLHTRPHEVLCRYTAMGVRKYVSE
jgi:alanine racemase